MKLNDIKNNKGFTLLELIIAMTIVSIISLAFFTVINSSIKQNVKNEKDIKSLNIAQSEIESLRSQIKSSKNLNIYDDEGDILINIPNGEDIQWTPSESESKKFDLLNIKNGGIYDKYIYIEKDGSKNNKILRYERTLEGDPIEYAVKLDLSRENKTDEYYLYTIEVSVKSKNENFSKKETVLATKVLSR